MAQHRDREQDRSGYRLPQIASSRAVKGNYQAHLQQFSQDLQGPGMHSSQSYNQYQQPYGRGGHHPSLAPGYGQPGMGPPFGQPASSGPYDEYGMSGPPNSTYGYGYNRAQHYNSTSNYGGYPTHSANNYQNAAYNAGMGLGMGYEGNTGIGMSVGMGSSMGNVMNSGQMNSGMLRNANQMGMHGNMNQPYGGGFKNNADYYGRSNGQFHGQNYGKNQASANLASAPTLQTDYNGRHQHFAGNADLGGNSLHLMSTDSETGEDDTGDVQGSPTPKSKLDAHAEAFEFESRNVDQHTPQHQSIHGQFSATDPKKEATSILLAKSLSVGGPPSRVGGPTKLSEQAGPPKMLSLLISSGGDDPFASSVTRTVQNPFSPITAMTSPLAARFASVATGMSRQLAAFTNDGKRTPSIDEALAIGNLPFYENARTARHMNNGVVKIANVKSQAPSYSAVANISQIPYNVTRAEIIAYLGRNARLISEQDNEPIHIIMERITSKTNDCYVEFIDMDEAMNAVARAEAKRINGRTGRLGARFGHMELSNQGALMKELFPKAKNVDWTEGHPNIIPTAFNDKYNSGFQGFISSEEWVMMQKHVECPQRSPYSKQCPQRPFECLISTLYKYPWYMVDYITIEDRERLVEVMTVMVAKLNDRIMNGDDINLNVMLLRRVVKAAVNCPGLTPTQKDNVCMVAGYDDTTILQFGVPHRSHNWGVFWTLAPKPDFADDMVMQWYINKLREAANKDHPLSLSEQAGLSTDPEDIHQRDAYGIFYDFKRILAPALFNELLPDRVDLPRSRTRILKATLAQVGALEWAVIERTLRSVLE
ncbi:hypothetical protein PVAG01_00037 [Phlyctema vagabunda]|uniref:RRM domain-containing protein n=1 Tax=Phlyctema vagabunda TaxID=108571 RepID=A0ABR4PT29_9HELO